MCVCARAGGGSVPQCSVGPRQHIVTSNGSFLYDLFIYCVWVCVDEWVSEETLWGAFDRKRHIAPDEQVGTLHGSLCHQCINVCVNG